MRKGARKQLDENFSISYIISFLTLVIISFTELNRDLFIIVIFSLLLSKLRVRKFYCYQIKKIQNKLLRLNFTISGNTDPNG